MGRRRTEIHMNPFDYGDDMMAGLLPSETLFYLTN